MERGEGCGAGTARIGEEGGGGSRTPLTEMRGGGEESGHPAQIFDPTLVACAAGMFLFLLLFFKRPLEFQRVVCGYPDQHKGMFQAGGGQPSQKNQSH